jgi:hypothetical protein
MHLVTYHGRSLKGRRNEIFSFLAGYSVSESFLDLTPISKSYALCSNAASRRKAMLVIRLMFIYQNYFEPGLDPQFR